MKTKASLDTNSKLITFGIFILFCFIGQAAFKEIKADGNQVTKIFSVGMIILLAVIFVGCYFLSTRGYTLTKDKLIIHRPLKDRIVDVDDIADVFLVDPSSLKGTLRAFGVGGLFGYFGQFSNDKFGKMTWYVTQKKNRILVETRQKEKIIISPDDISLLDNLKSDLN